MKRIWAHQGFVAVDQLVNAILAGWADETISARAGAIGEDPLGSAAIGESRAQHPSLLPDTVGVASRKQKPGRGYLCAFSLRRNPWPPKPI